MAKDFCGKHFVCNKKVPTNDDGSARRTQIVYFAIYGKDNNVVVRKERRRKRKYKGDLFRLVACRCKKSLADTVQK